MSAVPGIKNALEPITLDPMDPTSGMCSGAKAKTCEGLLSVGESVFVETGEANVHFMLYAYADDRHAAAAYDALWKGWSMSVKPPTRNEAVGVIGERRDAVRGTFQPSSSGDPAVAVQVRVGTTLLVTHAYGSSKEWTSGDRIKALATMFTERSWQAQAGRNPSAQLE
ncbi:hypothetical protein ACFW3A_06240 [Streptomyces pilosus]|uniref:hypothetical protein n=1 Tax=Streptomyces pilosus TaxID=28893 RepID=UPI00363B8B9C